MVPLELHSPWHFVVEAHSEELLYKSLLNFHGVEVQSAIQVSQKLDEFAD